MDTTDIYTTISNESSTFGNQFSIVFLTPSFISAFGHGHMENGHIWPYYKNIFAHFLLSFSLILQTFSVIIYSIYNYTLSKHVRPCVHWGSLLYQRLKIMKIHLKRCITTEIEKLFQGLIASTTVKNVQMLCTW